MQDRRYDNEISTLKQLQQCAENSEDLQYCSKLVQSYKTVLQKVCKFLYMDLQLEQGNIFYFVSQLWCSGSLQ